MDDDAKYELYRDNILEERKDCIHKKEDNQCEVYNCRCYFVMLCGNFTTKKD